MLAQLDHAHARAAALHRTSREASPAKHASPGKLPPRQVQQPLLRRRKGNCLVPGARGRSIMLDHAAL